MPRGLDWTEAQDTAIIAGRRMRATWREIASAVGREASAVRERGRRLNVGPGAARGRRRAGGEVVSQQAGDVYIEIVQAGQEDDRWEGRDLRSFDALPAGHPFTWEPIAGYVPFPKYSHGGLDVSALKKGSHHD